MRNLRLLVLTFAIGLLATACGGGGGPGKVDSYVALVPRVLRAGETESVSFSLFSGERLAAGDVRVALMQEDTPVIEASAHVDGKGTVEVRLPVTAKGEYRLVVNGPGFEDEARVQVQQGTLLFLETDKPIYKPGQTVHIRVVALNSELKPLSTQVTVEVQDAKAIKVFKKDVTTDEFGMAKLDLPLSTEPNLGVWKLSARSGDTSTEIDVRVEEYVLPKYEVKVELPKQWFLVSEAIKGHVSAVYSFGKPVTGDLRVQASRYVGGWEEFATFNVAINEGAADFEGQAAGYVAGVPEAGGEGNVTLDVSVVEKNTGYEEKTTQLVTVVAAPVNIQLIPEGPVFKPSLPYNVLVVTETPDGQPVEANVDLDVTYMDQNYNQMGHEQRRIETQRGSGLLSLTPPEKAVTLSANATSGDAYAYKQVGAAYSPSGNFIHLEQEDARTMKIGEEARFHVSSTSEARNFYYEIVARDRVVFTGATDSPEIAFTVTPAMAPSAKLLVYQVLPTSEGAAVLLPF